MDCYFISSETNNIALQIQLQKKIKKGLVFNPFKQIAMYETDEIVLNPYEGNNEITEEEWNKIVENNRKKSDVRAYVKEVEKDVPLFEYVEIETINRCNGVCSFCPVNKLVDTRLVY